MSKKPIPDHEADGIQELDNPAPLWWQICFYACIVFALGYYAYYEVGNGKSSDQALQEELYAVELARSQNKGSAFDESAILALHKDSSAMSLAKTQFNGKCAACHGAQMQGGIGPNLTDDYWIHGGTTENILTVIKKGALDKGMPAWEALLNEKEQNSIVAYIVSLRGSNPAGAKAPQGEKVNP